MGFTSFVDQFKAKVLGPAIDARMIKAGEAGKAEAVARVPVKTGKLRDSIGYIYNQQTKILTLYADMPYGGLVEFGTARARAQPYLRPGLAAMGRTWGGNVEVQFPTLAKRYAIKTLKFTGGKAGRANLHVFHKKPGRR